MKLTMVNRINKNFINWFNNHKKTVIRVALVLILLATGTGLGGSYYIFHPNYSYASYLEPSKQKVSEQSCRNYIKNQKYEIRFGIVEWFKR